MNPIGLSLCTRYSYPPNSLSFCGPDKKSDLLWYSTNQKADIGTSEILSDFSTLFPYLLLIAQENNIKDPFDPRIIEAYWIGNNLLNQVRPSIYIKYLDEKLQIQKRVKRKKDAELVMDKVARRSIPHHSFHVVNIYKRTGNVDLSHTIETMDACIINWGKIKKILPSSIIVETKPLVFSNGKIVFGRKISRNIMSQGEKDVLFDKLDVGDWISYHWGYFCQKLSKHDLDSIRHYTQLSLNSFDC